MKEKRNVISYFYFWTFDSWHTWVKINSGVWNLANQLTSVYYSQLLPTDNTDRTLTQGPHSVHDNKGSWLYVVIRSDHIANINPTPKSLIIAKKLPLFLSQIVMNSKFQQWPIWLFF